MVAAMGKVSRKRRPYATVGVGGLRRGYHLARGLGSTARSGGKVHSVNLGGLRSMAMASGMVRSSSSKITLASGGLARGLGSTAASGEVYSSNWGGLLGLSVRSLNTGGFNGLASKGGSDRSANLT